MNCNHPIKKREFDKNENLVCTVCQEILKAAAPEPVTDLFAKQEPEDAVIVSKEPCKSAADCASAGADCTEEGHDQREGACFEKKPEDSGLFTAGEETNEFRGIADHSASIPETVETTTTADTSGPFFCKLEVHLPEAELAEKGEEMARLIGLWTKAKLDLKAYQKAAKKVIDEYEERYIDLAEIVEAGTEEREVQCFWQFDAPHGIKKLIRCDTGDIVKESTMELLDYSACGPEYQMEKSIANVEAAFGQTEEEPSPFAEEPSRDESGEATEGEIVETQGNGATEKSDGFVDRPEDCTEEGCLYVDRCPPTCNIIKMLAEDKL